MIAPLAKAAEVLRVAGGGRVVAGKLAPRAMFRRHGGTHAGGRLQCALSEKDISANMKTWKHRKPLRPLLPYRWMHG